MLARQRNYNFVGEGGRIEHFRKAKRMRAFQVNADIEKQIFSTNYKKHVYFFSKRCVNDAKFACLVL